MVQKSASHGIWSLTVAIFCSKGSLCSIKWCVVNDVCDATCLPNVLNSTMQNLNNAMLLSNAPAYCKQWAFTYILLWDLAARQRDDWISCNIDHIVNVVIPLIQGLWGACQRLCCFTGRRFYTALWRFVICDCHGSWAYGGTSKACRSPASHRQFPETGSLVTLLQSHLNRLPDTTVAAHMSNDQKISVNVDCHCSWLKGTG